MAARTRGDMVVLAPLILVGLAILALAVIGAPPPMRYVAGAGALTLLPILALGVYVHTHDEVEPGPGEPVIHLPGSWVKQALLASTMLGLAGACGMILFYAARIDPYDGRAWFVGVTGLPVLAFFGMECLRNAMRPTAGLRVDDAGLHILETGECLAWRDLAKVEPDRSGFTVTGWLKITMRSGEVRRLAVRGAVASRHTLPALFAYAEARTDGLQPANLAQAVQQP